MSVLNGPIVLTGAVGIKPMIKYMLSTDSMSTITAAGYLNENLTNLNAITETDMLLIRYNYVQETNAGTNAFFTVSIASNGIITLAEDVAEGNVVLPVTTNDLALFADTNGKIKIGSAGATANTPSFIACGGVGGFDGKFTAKVSTPNVGSFTFLAAPNATNNIVTFSHEGQDVNLIVKLPKVASQSFALVNMMEWDNVTAPATVGNILKAATTKGILVDAGIAASRLMLNGFANPDVGANLISFDITVGVADLAAAASKILYTSTGAKQYKIRAMWINAGGTNFSGGGGNRAFQITDGTTVYSAIPAGSLTTIVNREWDQVADFPFPAGSVALNTSTVAGASLVMKYSGGTLDYTAGSVVISGLLERVA